MRDYYAILGIIKTAEDIVIKAAYRALAQKYHPDKFSGDTAESQRKMQEINEAYSILSDPEKRRAYDETYDFQSPDTETENEYFDEDLDKTWKEITEYFPDLIDIERYLAKISKQLAHTFRYSLIESKQFEKRKEVAEFIQEKYLQSYFGNNKEIIEFGKVLILCRYKDAAKKLNRAVDILGSDVNPRIIIDKLKANDLDKEQRTVCSLMHNRENNYAKNIAASILFGEPDLRNMKFFIQHLGGALKENTDNPKLCRIEIHDSLYTKLMEIEEMHHFCRSLAALIYEHKAVQP
jgi:curved DNA-binding protein CbpA